MRGPVARAVAAVLAAFAVGGVDYAITSSRVDPVPAPCRAVSDPVCNEDRSDAFEERLDEVIELERGLEGRAWLYSLLGALGGAAPVLLWLRTRPEPEERRRVLGSLGVAAVGLALVASVLLIAAQGLVSPPATQMYLPCAVLAGVAVVGRGRLRVPEPRGRAPAYAALGLTALTVLLVILFAGPQPDCGTAEAINDRAPGWTGAVAVAAVLSALGAAGAGVAALVLKRWIAAAVAFFVNPLALLAMAGSTCAFY